jgi:CelD/BcsL family acetyltransferase involved in cellulose biosynthesis
MRWYWVGIDLGETPSRYRSGSRIRRPGLIEGSVRFPASDVFPNGYVFGMSSNLSVARIHSFEELAHRMAEWDALDEQQSPRTPFTSPLWMRLWWKHFRRQNLKFRDSLYLHTVENAQGRLVAVVPLMKSCFPRLPLVRVIQFLGNDPAVTEIRGVICRREDHDNVIAALTNHFIQHQNEWELFRWNGLWRKALDYGLAADHGEFIERRLVPDYTVELPASWDCLTARVSSNMRKNIRKTYEFLSRDGFEFAVNVVERREEIDAAVQRFLTLHAARSETPDMVYHPKRFANPRERAFLLEYLDQIAEKGQLRIFELEIDGEVVASRITFLLGTELYMYFSGYNPSWKKYGIMTLLVAEIIKWAIGQRLQRVNLSTGNDQSKLRWKPDELIYSDCLQVSPTLRGKFAFRGFQAYESLSQFRTAAAPSSQ